MASLKTYWDNFPKWPIAMRRGAVIRARKHHFGIFIAVRKSFDKEAVANGGNGKNQVFGTSI